MRYLVPTGTYFAILQFSIPFMPTHFLHRFFPPGPFSEAELDRILPQFQAVHFQKNDFLLREGQASKYYWFVESGFIRAYAVDLKGNEVSTQFYTRGDIAIDWPAFLQQRPTRQHLQALSDCHCWQLDFERFQEFFHSIEAFREAGRARLVNSYFELQEQAISMIVDQAKERYQKLLAEKPSLLHNVPLKQLASYLGITDTSLSRIRKEIARE